MNEVGSDTKGIYSMKFSDFDVVENIEGYDWGRKNKLYGIYYPEWDDKATDTAA